MPSIKYIGHHNHQTNNDIHVILQVAGYRATRLMSLPVLMFTLLVVVVGPGLVLLLPSVLLMPGVSVHVARVYAQDPSGVQSGVPLGPTATPTCQSGWSVVNSPNPSSTGNFLYGVTSIA